MPPRSRGPYLWLRQYPEGHRKKPTWLILDGRKHVWTGIPPDEKERAEHALRAYCAARGVSAADAKATVSRARNGIVYFASCDFPGFPIKIGFAGDVLQRLTELQCALPYKIMLLGSMAGTYQTERDLHSLFKKYRLRNEWFRRSEELLAFIGETGTLAHTWPKLRDPAALNINDFLGQIS